ncbi:MAG: 1-acyl-sn-glycerol-3-phosphate acyltransferase [Myxococcales bacterium]|nr:1-acyl-sn-glycerol-3-phosphate acyltransferase [Myxococcales bacterium]MCB9526444.1 1-acyl-sn-glycerol-3-phosphate acyltransferase [Myxococcales bacterium]
MNPPIFQFNRHRGDIEREVVSRAVEAFEGFGSARGPRALQLALNDAAYHEIHRLERAKGREAERLSGWQKLARRIGRMDEGELRDEVRRLATWYVQDVVGHFDRRVYRFATQVLPVGLGALFNATDLGGGIPRNLKAFGDLSQRIRVEGDLPHLRALAEKGTLVVVPTHSSNLDSVVLGWSLMHAGLPPVTYGAGKNLFTNPVTGYFMRNLGAYRVDRRLRHSLYKGVLKIYSQVLLERGYHSLFFPGGTRSRSGLVEQKLKLGLLGSALAGFAERRHRGDDRPIYVVPVTINYPLVLEAETLIEDHLKEAGQARYIIEDDEFSRIGRVSHFAIKLMGMDTTMVIRYGAPLDVFGNRIDEKGRSIGPDGTVLDPGKYLERDGRPVADAGRDAEYTRQLGRRVAAAFLSETVLLPTNLLGWLLFQREKAMAPHLDLFALLRTTSGDRHDRAEICAALERLRRKLVAMEDADRVKLDPLVREGAIDELLDDAINTFGMYHTHSALERSGDSLVVRDPKLLFFYGNRLAHWTDELVEAVQP